MLTHESSETYFNHTNHLGSTTMRTDHTGASVDDVLFYPWGNVWQSWGNGGYNFACLPYRDVTTTTDITTARFSSPNFGRWFTPDPIGKAASRLDDPQTWNMYAYVRNNPTTLTDPSGLTVPDSCAKDKNCTIVVKVNVIYDQTVNGGKGLTTEQKQKFQSG